MDATFLNNKMEPVADPPLRNLPQERVEELAQMFIAELRRTGSSRELSLAITNAEQALLWANNHFQKMENN